VFPENADIDVVPLYWDVDQAPFAAPRRDSHGAAVEVPHTPVGTINLDHLIDRRRALVPAGSRASTATYFNAFPAAYWRRWTRVDEVTLTVRASGAGARVSVYKSTADGRLQRVHTERLADLAPDEVGEVRIPLSLRPFVDGGWYWFDLIAGHEDAVLERAWYAHDGAEDTPHGSVTVSVTTFDRPSWCVALLEQLADAVDEADDIDAVQIVDQGSQRVRDAPGFTAVADRLGGRLRMIEQPNLGGSGGFARGMDEARQAALSTYILLLDDDVVLERESIRRAVAFADQCRRPTIVGGHMFSSYARASLHSMGEVVARGKFFWGPAPNVVEDHDFAVQSLRATPWMHRRVDVDYNGWWMCLIPIEVVKTVGLALPVFIKWDDAEYGLRAQAAGFPTVTLPGMALWHVPWTDKDDTLDWQAYFHQRNRLVAALLHSEHDHGGTVLRDSFAHQVKHILSMQYSTARLRLTALEDVMTGPEHLHATLPTALAQLRAVRIGHADATIRPDPEEFPAPLGRNDVGQPARPRGRVQVLRSAAAAMLRQARPVPAGANARPQEVVPARDADWWRLSRLDSALVSSRDGGGVAWYRRDRDQALHLLRRSVDAYAALWREWPALRDRYRDAAVDITGPSTWAMTFGAEG
jgi:galactofuranosylgalactofuranosylrhamnosyl-N-acetylglucosaminyl-diphospho-decaprenol beta-1,5/1,6-galactofuranosyltransferase